jgi:hypothetical protein
MEAVYRNKDCSYCKIGAGPSSGILTKFTGESLPRDVEIDGGQKTLIRIGGQECIQE